MTTATTDVLRTQLRNALAWEDAHVTLDAALADVPAAVRGRSVPGVPWTLWQLVDHMRRTQFDILDFAVNSGYVGLSAEDHWPPSAEPPDDAAWDECLAQIRRDRATLEHMAVDPACDLSAQIPHGTGQTYGRALLLVIDHNAYHVGQIVLLRRMLGAWPG